MTGANDLPRRPRHAIIMDRITKRYGALAALDDLSMRVRAGEIYGLIGPNGSGKTTAIRVLTGLTRATAGRAWVLGEATPPDAARRLIGYMPQEPALYNDLTIWENLDTFRRIHSMPRATFCQQAERLLRLVALQDRSDSVISELSGGMKRRVSLITAMLHHPRLLVLDEPTVGVDPELRANFWSFFRRLQANGVTILMTTHYMDEARHCGRVGLMDKGRLIAEGGPASLVESTGQEDLESAFLHLAARSAP